MKFERTMQEVETLLDEAIERAFQQTKYPGMTYEEGVLATLDWLFGRNDDSPLED